MKITGYFIEISEVKRLIDELIRADDSRYRVYVEFLEETKKSAGSIDIENTVYEYFEMRNQEELRKLVKDGLIIKQLPDCRTTNITAEAYCQDFADNLIDSFADLFQAERRKVVDRIEKLPPSIDKDALQSALNAEVSVQKNFAAKVVGDGVVHVVANASEIEKVMRIVQRILVEADCTPDSASSSNHNQCENQLNFSYNRSAISSRRKRGAGSKSRLTNEDSTKPTKYNSLELDSSLHDISSRQQLSHDIQGNAAEFTSAATDKADANEKSHRPADTESNEEECSICFSTLIASHTEILPCSHKYCRGCVNKIKTISKSSLCPQCKQPFTTPRGPQPKGGTMKVYSNSTRLPGYDTCGTIVIMYNIPSGTQTAEHPHPGQPYSGTSRTAYLPDNAEGRRVSRLLRKAFDAGLIFNVGRSITTGADNQVVWNDIHHKTSFTGTYGYPDSSYLSSVEADLKARGISE